MSMKNQWTVMFYFAGDNPLSPLVVSQIKAIKDAGYQKDTEVLIHFDCYRQSAPTRLYRVNQYRKEDATPPTLIGDGDDPWVRNFIEDIIDSNDISKFIGKETDDPRWEWTKKMGEALRQPKATTANDSLNNFMGFCRENFPAEHYMLILVGHGMIVGSDTFLPDESTGSAITLKQLDEAVRGFSAAAKGTGVLELLALHSCSMSAIEVAYQLQGAASYMIASEGLSYVGSWPYRQLIKKTFNSTEKPDSRVKDPVWDLIHDLFYLTLFSATDFMLSGYSLDLTLSRLDPKLYKDFKTVLVRLVQALKKGLDDLRGNELIVMAHWESQSFWGEQYTDLYDFCDCLRNSCTGTVEVIVELKTACEGMLSQLTNSRKANSNDTIVHCAENFGTAYQYAHGMSIYFPWSKPSADYSETEKSDRFTSPVIRSSFPWDSYKKYKINRDLGGDSWDSFLEQYWKKTMRGTRTGHLWGDSVGIGGKELGSHEKELGSHEKELGSHEKELGSHEKELGSHEKELGSHEKELGSHEKELVSHGAGGAGGEIGTMEKELGSHEKEVGSHEGPDKEIPSHGQSGIYTSVKNFPSIETIILDKRGKKRTIVVSDGLKKTFEDDSKWKSKKQDKVRNQKPPTSPSKDNE